jgi:hypothetical protein
MSWRVVVVCLDDWQGVLDGIMGILEYRLFWIELSSAGVGNLSF